VDFYFRVQLTMEGIPGGAGSDMAKKGEAFATGERGKRGGKSCFLAQEQHPEEKGRLNRI